VRGAMKGIFLERYRALKFIKISSRHDRGTVGFRYRWHIND
jgi:hypothetical protein